MNYWMLKSEPDVFGIADLKKKKTTIWDGVRNYQARIYLRSAAVGDLAFFYHSNTEVTGIAGVCKVVATLVPDPTQFDADSDYFDPKSTRAAPRWETVKVEFVEQFKQVVSLEILKQNFAAEELLVVRKGNRLSVMPVSAAAADRLLTMGRAQ